jgi:hypothetical protein
MLVPRIFFALGAVALGSCAGTNRDRNDPFGFERNSLEPLSARQKAYERLASYLERGMTRRQLYALLPPRRPPIMYPKEPDSPFAFPVLRLPNFELHPLDGDFALYVAYDLATSKDTAQVVIRQPTRLQELVLARPIPRPGRKSKEDMDDVLNFKPIVFRLAAATKQNRQTAPETPLSAR